MVRGVRPPTRAGEARGFRQRDLRVYYDIQGHPENVVTVLAVGIKDRHRVRIGDEEVKL